MATLIFGMNMSLDGFVDYDRFAPDPALFRYFIEQTRKTAGSIYGPRLYELMSYWDSDAWNQDGRAQDDLRAFAEAADFPAEPQQAAKQPRCNRDVRGE